MLFNNRGLMLLALFATTFAMTSEPGRRLELNENEIDEVTLNDLRLGVKTRHTGHANLHCALHSACDPDGAKGMGPVVNKCLPTSTSRGIGAVTAHILPIHLLMISIMGPKWCLYGAGKFWFYQWWGWYIQPFTSYLGDYIEKVYTDRDFKANSIHRKAAARQVKNGTMTQDAFDAKFVVYAERVYVDPIQTDGTNDPFLTGGHHKSTVHFAGRGTARVEDADAKAARLAHLEHEQMPHLLRAEGKHEDAQCIERWRMAKCPVKFLGNLLSCVCCPVTSSAAVAFDNIPHNCAEWQAGRNGGFALRRQRRVQERQDAAVAQGAVTTAQRAAENEVHLTEEMKINLMMAIRSFRCCTDNTDCFAMEKLQADVGLVFPTLAGHAGMAVQQRLELAIFEQIVADPELSDTLLAHSPHAANLHNFLCGDNVYIQGRYGAVRSINETDNPDMLEIRLSTDMSASRDMTCYLEQYGCFNRIAENEHETTYQVNRHDLEIGNVGISGTLFQFHNGHANKFWSDKSRILFEEIEQIKEVLRGAAGVAMPAADDEALQAGDLAAAIAHADLDGADAEADAAYDQLPTTFGRTEDDVASGAIQMVHGADAI